MKKYLNGLQHIGIPTQFFEKTLDFYKKLGFDVVYQTKNNDDDVAFLRNNNLTIETYTSAQSASGGAIDHIALDVTDIEKAHNAAIAAGFNLLDDGEIFFLNFWDNGIKYFKIMGPNNEVLEFSQIL